MAAGAGACPFRLAVINDEITQDFEKACQIVSGDFGLQLDRAALDVEQERDRTRCERN